MFGILIAKTIFTHNKQQNPGIFKESFYLLSFCTNNHTWY